MGGGCCGKLEGVEVVKRRSKGVALAFSFVCLGICRFSGFYLGCFFVFLGLQLDGWGRGMDVRWVMGDDER